MPGLRQVERSLGSGPCGRLIAPTSASITYPRAGSTRWSGSYSDLVLLIHQTNEYSVAAITSPHGGPPTRPFAFPLFTCDLTAKVPIKFHGELLGGQVADAEAL